MNDKNAVNLVIAIAIVVVGIIGSVAIFMGFRDSRATVAAPQPTITVTATATTTVTATAKASVSGNTALLRAAWASMSDADKATIRSGWTTANRTVAGKAEYVRVFGNTIRETLPTLTDQEIIDWLDWTLIN